MKNIKTILVFVILAISLNLVYAAETLNCSVNNSAATHCSATKHKADALGYNVKIVRDVDLNPIIKSFRKLISQKLNTNSCEKKVFIKSAKLAVKGESLVIDLRARLTRQYCTRRAKKQLYEKTNNLIYTLLPAVSETAANFVVQSTKPHSSTNLASFEKSFTDVEGMNIKHKISQALNAILNLAVENIDLSSKPITPIVYRSAVIDPNTNLMTVELATTIE